MAIAKQNDNELESSKNSFLRLTLITHLPIPCSTKFVYCNVNG